MTDAHRVTTWVNGYIRAWNSNERADIGALFTDHREFTEWWMEQPAPQDPV